MGEFEDLVDRASTGDDAAAELLKTKFGGSSLRQQAESGAEAQRRYEESLPDIRAGKFHAGLGSLPEELRGKVTVDDVKGVKPEEITPEHLRSLAESKVESEKAHLLTQAKDLGFETVEEMQEALGKVKEEQTAKRREMEAIGGATSSSGSGAPAPTSQFNKAKTTYTEARDKGMAQDYALGKVVEVLMGEDDEA